MPETLACGSAGQTGKGGGKSTQAFPSDSMCGGPGGAAWLGDGACGGPVSDRAGYIVELGSDRQ